MEMKVPGKSVKRNQRPLSNTLGVEVKIEPPKNVQNEIRKHLEDWSNQLEEKYGHDIVQMDIKILIDGWSFRE